MANLKTLALGTFGLSLSLSSGCGPILYQTEYLPASRVVERAEQSGADERAIYDFYTAKAYLEQAREKDMLGFYELAAHYAEIAKNHAEQALKVPEKTEESSPEVKP